VFRHLLSEPSDEQAGDEADTVSNNPLATIRLDIRPVIGSFNILLTITDYEHRTMLETTRTYVAKITNHQQVRDDLDACGFAASKLWNVGRYYIQGR